MSTVISGESARVTKYWSFGWKDEVNEYRHFGWKGEGN